MIGHDVGFEAGIQADLITRSVKLKNEQKRNIVNILGTWPPFKVSS